MSIRKKLPKIIRFMYSLRIKKLVQILILLIVIGTLYIMPKNSLVNLFTATIFTVLILFSRKVIKSIAYSTISLFIVLSSALELIRLRN